MKKKIVLLILGVILTISVFAKTVAIITTCGKVVYTDTTCLGETSDEIANSLFLIDEHYCPSKALLSD